MFVLLLACSGEVEVATSQSACTDVDFDNPAPSELNWAEDGDGARVWRTYVFLNEAGLHFDPILAVDNGVLRVDERWTDPTSEDPFCYVPELAITGYVGSLEVQWFLEGEAAVPVATVVVD